MARNNKFICATCGKEFEWCEKCSFVQPNFDHDRYCDKNCADIFAILSKHGCHLATAEETLDALKPYDLAQEFTPGIKAHIDALKAEVAIAKEAEAKPIEVNKSAPIEEKEVKSTTDFFKKK